MDFTYKVKPDLEENTKTNLPSESRERSQEARNMPPIMKNANSRDNNKTLIESSSKDISSPGQNKAQTKTHRNSKILNKSINNDVLKEKSNIIESVAKTKPTTKANALVNESFNSPKYIFNLRGPKSNNTTINQDLLNESTKSEVKSHNNPIFTGVTLGVSGITGIGSVNMNDQSQTISDYNSKRVDTSHHSSPKDKKGSLIMI